MSRSRARLHILLRCAAAHDVACFFPPDILSLKRWLLWFQVQELHLAPPTATYTEKSLSSRNAPLLVATSWAPMWLYDSHGFRFSTRSLFHRVVIGTTKCTKSLYIHEVHSFLSVEGQKRSVPFPTSTNEPSSHVRLRLPLQAGAVRRYRRRQELHHASLRSWDLRADNSCTIGAAYGARTLSIGCASVKLQIWDTAGSDRYHASRLYFCGAMGVMLVYDVTSRMSFRRLDDWIGEVNANCG